LKHDFILRAAAYIRVSTEDQMEYSPDSQLKKIREYAEHQNILLIEDCIFIDEGISGRHTSNRPAFLRMIQAARQKPHSFDQILVWKFSRFARNRQDSIFYKSMLRKECGVDVVSVTEQLSDDPTSVLIEALLEAMDEYYSLNLAQEVRRGMNEKFSRGGVVSIPPFGYRMKDGHFEADPDTAPYVKCIFEDYLSGLHPLEIAEKLNKQGISTRRGNAFTARAVRYILANPFYAGYQRRNLSESSKKPPVPVLTTVRGQYIPLISEADFQSAQLRLRLQKHSHPSTPLLFLDETLHQDQHGKDLQSSGQHVKNQYQL
jgi:DNA invertase Pin-like site-specific DNA recombinase